MKHNQQQESAFTMMSRLARRICFSLLLLGMATHASAIVTWTSHADGETHQYTFVVDYDITWTDANMASADYGTGWHLATVTSFEEQEFLRTSLYSQIVDGHKYWLGAYQDAGQTDPTAGWNWVTGEQWDYTNWGNSINLDSYSGTSEEYLYTTSYMVWQWDDAVVDGRIHGYILERSGESVNVPEPGTLALFGTGLIGLGLMYRRKKLG